MSGDTDVYDSVPSVDAVDPWSAPRIEAAFAHLITPDADAVTEWALSSRLGALDPNWALPRADLAAQYQYHMRLFRALYLWGDRLLAAGELLVVDPLGIRRTSLGEGRHMPDAVDALREHYLHCDLDAPFDLAAVSRLIADMRHRQTVQAQLQTAYRTLGLSPTDGPERAKRAYQRLSMRHHPDRGGDASVHVSLSRAWRLIRTQA